MTTRDAVIVAGARTPMATYNTHFKDLPETALGALAAKAALERARVAPQRIDQVVMGNALQTSGNAIYGARHVALKARLPETVPALTVNRLCGSGLQAVSSAADLLALGEAEVVLAGGMENMTQAPHVLRGMRSGLKMGNAVVEDLLVASLLDTHCGCSMSQTAENLAEETGVTRAEADAYALLSQQRAETAVKAGRLAEEIVPVTVRDRGRDVVVSEDNHRRPETTLEGLAKLPAAFGGRGFVTAGNASGIVDGAAAVVMTTGALAQKEGKKPIAYVRGWSYVGVDPSIMGFGPAPAIRKVLERTGLKLEQIDLFEINEAFAGQYLAVEKDLGLNRDKVNVNGGAIGLGHPLGATGTRLIYSLIVELGLRGKKYGVASACIGGGQGMAVLVERA